MHDQSRQKQVIERWMLSVANDGGIDRFDDLHIDKIDEQWKERSGWIWNGIEALKLAVEIRDERALKVTIALVFSLKSYEEARGVNFLNLKELEQILDESSPSIYVFRVGEEPWSIMQHDKTRGQVSDVATELSCSQFGFLPPIKSCFYIEFKQDDTEEFCRSVSLGA